MNQEWKWPGKEKWDLESIIFVGLLVAVLLGIGVIAEIYSKPVGV